MAEYRTYTILKMYAVCKLPLPICDEAFAKVTIIPYQYDFTIKFELDSKCMVNSIICLGYISLTKYF